MNKMNRIDSVVKDTKQQRFVECDYHYNHNNASELESECLMGCLRKKMRTIFVESVEFELMQLHRNRTSLL